MTSYSFTSILGVFLSAFVSAHWTYYKIYCLNFVSLLLDQRTKNFQKISHIFELLIRSIPTDRQHFSGLFTLYPLSWRNNYLIEIPRPFSSTTDKNLQIISMGSFIHGIFQAALLIIAQKRTRSLAINIFYSRQYCI